MQGDGLVEHGVLGVSRPIRGRDTSPCFWVARPRRPAHAQRSIRRLSPRRHDDAHARARGRRFEYNVTAMDGSTVERWSTLRWLVFHGRPGDFLSDAALTALYGPAVRVVSHDH